MAVENTFRVTADPCTAPGRGYEARFQGQNTFAPSEVQQTPPALHLETRRTPAWPHPVGKGCTSPRESCPGMTNGVKVTESVWWELNKIFERADLNKQ